MTDGEKARALWEFLRRNRFHATTGDFEVRDPVKMFNVYGFALCGDNAPRPHGPVAAAGLRARRGFPIGHCVVEAWYDGGWHMLDGDESIVFLNRDNRTIASEQAVARDHDLSKRAYPSEYLPAFYNYDGTRSGDYPLARRAPMDFTLRPGEAIEWRWGQGEKHHYAPNPVLFLLNSTNLHEWGPDAWATLRNGRWTYAPPLRSPLPARGRGRRRPLDRRGEGPCRDARQAGEPATLRLEDTRALRHRGRAATARMRPGAAAASGPSQSRHDGREWKEDLAREASRKRRPRPVSSLARAAHYEYLVRSR